MQREERKVSSLHRERRARPLRKKKKEAKRSSMQQTIRSSAVDHSTRTSGRLREDSLEDESGGGEKRHLFLVTFFCPTQSRKQSVKKERAPKNDNTEMGTGCTDLFTVNQVRRREQD